MAEDRLEGDLRLALCLGASAARSHLRLMTHSIVSWAMGQGVTGNDAPPVLFTSPGPVGASNSLARHDTGSEGTS